MATPETVLVTGGSGFIAKEAPCGPCGRPCGSVSSGDETLTDIARLQRQPLAFVFIDVFAIFGA